MITIDENKIIEFCIEYAITSFCEDSQDGLYIPIKVLERLFKELKEVK